MSKEKSGLDRARSEFPLVEPVGGSEQLWNAYTVERNAIKENFTTVLLEENDSDESGYSEAGDGEIAAAIAETVGGLEAELGLPEDSLLSGIYILYEDSLFEEESQPRTAMLLTRIYSVSSPVSVDIHFTYHSRSRMSSVEWYSGIGYKINTRSSPNKLPKTSEILRQLGLPKNSPFSFSDIYTSNGWNNFYKAFFDDEMGFSGRHWKRYEVKKMGLYEDGLIEVHNALLGPHPCMDDENPSPENILMKRQRLVQTARLLLACVGVNCSIATKNSEEDSLPNRYNGLDWDLEGIPHWFARGIREAVGFQLERDATEAKRHTEAVQDEMKGHYGDEESDDDEERDYEGSDDDEEMYDDEY